MHSSRFGPRAVKSTAQSQPEIVPPVSVANTETCTSSETLDIISSDIETVLANVLQ